MGFAIIPGCLSSTGCHGSGEGMVGRERGWDLQSSPAVFQVLVAMVTDEGMVGRERGGGIFQSRDAWHS